MKEKNVITYVNAALFITLLIVVVVSVKGIIGRSTANVPVETARPEGLPIKERRPARIYDIEKVKGRDGKAAQAPKDLSDVFARYPRNDAGDNVITAWKNVDPKDKAKFVEVVGKKIVDMKERLKADPNDKRAKKLLFISESMKSLSTNDFNYEFKGAEKTQTVIANPPKADEAMTRRR